MDRRMFVKSSALGLAGIAATGVVAGTALADPTQTAAADALAGAGVSVAEASAPAWLGEEPQISADQITATYDTDILIVGAGCAGSAAAATAAEMGLNFICVERGATVPETREYLGAIDDTFALEAGVVNDHGKILNELSRYASGKCDRDLIKLWIENSAEMIDWVDGYLSAAGKEGTVTVTPDHETGGTDYMTPVTEHLWEPSYEFPMRNDVFAQAAADAGSPVLFNCKLLRLLHEDGAVTGGICDYAGQLIQINAQRTIIATGGYAGNPQMMMALQPDTVRCVTASSYHALDDGSGIRAGIWAGAAKENDGTPAIFDRGSVLPGQDSGYMTCEDGNLRFPGQNYQLNIGSQPFLKVNRRGERFANESTPYDNMLFAAGRQPGGVFCQVFDGNCDEDIVRFGTIGCASYTRAMIEYAGFTAEEFIDFDGGSETFFKAGSLDELADLLGFEGEDKERFLATCERYNELYDAQADDDYGKEAYRLSELRTPPFYGCWFGGSLLTTLDGLRINARLQVLDANYDVTPGLYAVGDASGGFFNTNYPEYFPGVAAGRSVTEGRQCVKMIAAEEGFVPTERTAQIAEPAAAPAIADCADGTYTGSWQGIGGMIDVTVQIENGTLSVVEIGPNYETPRYPGSFGISSGLFAEQIEAAQGTEIDGISAATLTTGAVKMALRDALLQAAAAK